MKYKVGDRVKIVSDRRGDWVDDMDICFGKVVTIKCVYLHYYKMEEIGWCWQDEMIEGLSNEEWKPKEGDVVLVRDDGTNWKERHYIMKSKAGTHLCGYGLNDDGSVCAGHVMYWDEIKKPEDKKRERKLMMTDSEWEKFQKDNNL